MGFQTLFAMVLHAATPAPAGVDTFGLAQFHPSRLGGVQWNSAHWGNGVARRVRYAPDPFDPTGWTDDHSGSTDGFQIDGAGTLTMSGGSPRFHIDATREGPRGAGFFLNTEFTGYWSRGGSRATAWGGLVVGARSGPKGHASAGGDDCDATTYYARFRNDGTWDFEKELKHPTSDYWSGSGFHTQDPLWKGAPPPNQRWIGIKYLVWNLPADQGVHLEAWIDSVSGGEPDRARWEKVGEVEDVGGWPAAPSPIAGCSYSDPRTPILQGHGTFLLRTDGDTARYKMVSIREIVPPWETTKAFRSAPHGSSRGREQGRAFFRWGPQGGDLSLDGRREIPNPSGP
ncbi:MAG: hypothetical protein H6686_11865 [Fibrobacteria bacterium]|nr:hypothetical protein [Fibrobacteria bacterium]